MGITMEDLKVRDFKEVKEKELIDATSKLADAQRQMADPNTLDYRSQTVKEAEAAMEIINRVQEKSLQTGNEYLMHNLNIVETEHKEEAESIYRVFDLNDKESMDRLEELSYNLDSIDLLKRELETSYDTREDDDNNNSPNEPGDYDEERDKEESNLPDDNKDYDEEKDKEDNKEDIKEDNEEEDTLENTRESKEEGTEVDTNTEQDKEKGKEEIDEDLSDMPSYLDDID